MSVVELGIVLLVALAVGVTIVIALVTGVPPQPSLEREQRDVIALLKRTELRSGARIYELGCGFGGLLMAIARAFPDADVHGIELSPLPFAIAWLRTRRLRRRVHVRLGDFYHARVHDADAVTSYLMIAPMPRLQHKLDRELRPGTPVVALTFWFRQRKPIATLGRAALYRWVSAAALSACVLILSACTGAQYLAQAVAGQMQLLDRRRPIAAVVADTHTKAQVRKLLALVPQMKAFAAQSGLTPTRNYECYVDLKRPAAVWVVSATPPLSFQAEAWWFPIVGSVPYLGWFGLADARAFAAALKRQGLDVSLRTASAYSTLGFFDDPILSTMLTDDPDAIGDLANTLFHESLHASLYLPGRTDISEGIASFVGERMARDYLRRFHDGAALAAYESSMARGKQRMARLRTLKAELETLYTSAADDVGKLRAKGQLLMAAKVEIAWKGVLNNATLAELGRYQSGEDALQSAFDACAHAWPCFLTRLRNFVKGPLDLQLLQGSK